MWGGWETNSGGCIWVASVCVFLLSFHIGKPLSNHSSNSFYKYWTIQTTLLNFFCLFILLIEYKGLKVTLFSKTDYLLHVLVMARCDIRMFASDHMKPDFYHICNRDVQGGLHMLCWAEGKIWGLRMEGVIIIPGLYHLAVRMGKGLFSGLLFLWSAARTGPFSNLMFHFLSSCATPN